MVMLQFQLFLHDAVRYPNEDMMNQRWHDKRLQADDLPPNPIVANSIELDWIFLFEIEREEKKSKRSTLSMRKKTTTKTTKKERIDLHTVIILWTS